MPPTHVSLAWLALGLASCVGTGSKTVDAVATAAIAGGLTVAEQVEAQRAARSAPTHGEYPSGCAVFDCYYDPDLSLDEARSYALVYVNHARASSGAVPLSLDYALNAFAQAGSKQLARDHRPHQHIADDPRACFQCSEEQSDPQGLASAPVRDQILGALDAMMSQGPGSATHDNLLAPGWHRLGVGIVNPDGLAYLTLDLAP